MTRIYVALLTLLVLARAILVSRRRFHALVSSEVAKLLSESGVGLGPDQLAARWDALPAPVRRYFRYAIPKGAPAIQTVRLRHDGYFRTKPGQRWFPVQGEEFFTVGKPGFVWHATMRPAPFLWIEARDRLLSGRGNMLVRFNSTFPVADASGPEIDQGAHLRWLAEVVWFPYGFIGERVRWDPIDDCSARATLLRADPPVSAVCEIDDQGRLVRVRGDRYRDIGGGRAVLTPWSGRCADYREFDGLRVPSSIEVSWHLEDGEFTCIRFRVTSLEYNVASRFCR